MKNVIIIITTIFIFLILYFLQVNFFNWFTIAGISPNLFVILVLFLGLFAGKRVGVPMGIFLGILLDFFASKKIGISAIMLGIIGIIAGVLDKNFSKDSRMTIILMTILSTAIYEVGIYILNYIIVSTNIEIILFVKILLIEAIYNAILTVILYPILQKAGYYIEEVFRGKQILTRYY
ncbi:MAG: rod shape-determining protein MreD [Clostridia bacterium]|nr:rod shape-determining protein MreD [Clostridia bacterium]